MYSEAKVCIFNTNVEPISSGNRTFKQNEVIDIVDLLECLKDSSKYVVISNDVSAHSEATKKQNFIVTDVLYPEEGFDATYMFTHTGRSASAVTLRRIMMSFGTQNGEPILKATYFVS